MNFMLKQRIFLKCIQPLMNSVKFIHINKISSPKIIVQTFPSLISKLNNSIPSDTEWKEIRSNLLSINSYKEQSIDSVLLDLCLNEIKSNILIDVLKSYFYFLRNNNYNINIAVSNKIIRALVYKYTISESEEDIIIWLYENVYKMFPVLDKFTSTVVIMGISLTTKWQEVEHLWNLSMQSGKFSWITACYQHGYPELGWKYLNMLDNYANQIQGSLIKYYIEYYTKKYDTIRAKNELIRLIKFCKERDMILNDINANDLINVCPSLDLHGTLITVNQTGICPNCENKLTKAYINNKEYDILTKLVLNKIIISSDIYQGTNPVELTKFMSFVDKTIPYDIVIDGLNMYYLNSDRRVLPILVSQFLNSNKKILIFIRKHLIKNLKHNPLYEHVRVFALDDLSKDDSFILYATLKSGRETKFISNDLMRTQKFLLEDHELQKLFIKWQMNNHLLVKSIDYKQKKVTFKHPINFPSNINMDSNGWHIPYANKEPSPISHQLLRTWICLRNSNSKQSRS